MAKRATNFEAEVTGIRVEKTDYDALFMTVAMDNLKVSLAHLPYLLQNGFENTSPNYLIGVVRMEVDFHFAGLS